jgi:LmbE family N-acetylglucosaminyl deacetylase
METQQASQHLIVAAHPDDEILGCGGTVARYSRRGHIFDALILTGGAEGRYDRKMADRLRNQALEAGEYVGIREVFIEDLPNQGLDHIPLTQVVETIEAYLARLGPQVLWVHSDSDLNMDHRIAYEAAVTAARPMHGQRVQKVFAYFVASATEWGRTPVGFVPNTFVDIKATLADKIKAMQCYESECRPYPHPRSPGAIEAYAAYWGLSAGFEFAEPFRLVHSLDHI